jgi:hypothetical protein
MNIYLQRFLTLANCFSLSPYIASVSTVRTIAKGHFNIIRSRTDSLHPLPTRMTSIAFLFITSLQSISFLHVLLCLLENVN